MRLSHLSGGIYAPRFLQSMIPHSKDRRFTYLHKDGIWREIEIYFNRLKVSADSHPLVADVCAGDGSVAALLIGRGWSPENIHCFDMARSPDPLVEGVNWCYWDLGNLAIAIRDGEDLSQNIENLKGYFFLFLRTCVS